MIVLLPMLAVPALAEEFKDEPEAHALYDEMIAAMRSADSLTWTSQYRWEAQGREIGRCTYRIWLKKPNRFRLETTKRDGKPGGILVGDGDNLWIRWPGERPHFSTEEHEDWERTKDNVYMRERTPLGSHSIAHKTGVLGAGMSMAILNPSVFHGYRGSLQPYLDGARSMGTETIGDEEFDVIEVSFMKHQRSQYYWISCKDRLPRKLKQVVRVSYDIISHETWSNVSVNPEIEDDLFVWTPPPDWQEWRLPKQRDRLLKTGTVAPDFKLDLRSGGKTSLADYRGKVIWLVFWRVG
jgi:outer membrane lipoprotein-sorting protein